MISVSNLSKRIGDVQALDNLSFNADDGQITGLLGPNGAGKTTCLRTIFGLLQADQGIATINGIDVAVKPIEAKQQLGLFPIHLEFTSVSRLGNIYVTLRNSAACPRILPLQQQPELLTIYSCWI